ERLTAVCGPVRVRVDSRPRARSLLHQDRIMTANQELLSRRALLRASTKGGFALGGLFGLGADRRAAQGEAQHLKIAGVKEVPSVCPYCAVGCGQLVHVNVREKKIINIEGNPESPISQGTLCPRSEER